MNNPLGNAKDAVAQRMMGKITPSEHPIGQALADSLVGVENRQAAAIQRAIEAGGLDIDHGHDPQQRRQTILGVADAVAQQDVEDWWWRNVAPEVLDKPERARQYVGLDGEQWREQLKDWYGSYHAAGVVDESIEDAEPGRLAWVADRHCQTTFGVSLREFVALVINWSRGQQARRVLAGPFMQHTAIIHRLADELERKEQRIEDLSGQLKESRS
jgi:hypothetical protein